MGWVSLALQAIAAIPKLIDFLGKLWTSIAEIRHNLKVGEVKKAISDGDTKKAEELIGSPNSGKPSGLDGVEMRPKP